SFPRWRQSCQPTGDPVPAWCAAARRPVLAWSAHGLGAVQGLADDVGVAGVLGRLRDHVQQHLPRRPARSRREPGRLRQRLGSVQVRQRRHQLVGPPRHLLVLIQQPGQRLPLQHLESPGPLVLVRPHRRRALEDEIGPLPFGEGDVLDQAAQAQLAHRGALPGLVVGQVADRETQEVPGLGQGGQQVGTLAGRSGLSTSVHGCPPSVRCRFQRYGPGLIPITQERGRRQPVSMRAIDFHVHLPTPDWLDGSMAGYVEATEAYFRSPVQRQSLPELAETYRQLETMAVLLAWDAETATGRPRVPNETVAAACRDHPDVFTGLGSVDPHKGEAAVAEVANIAALGLRGVKFHPSLQAFAPDDESYWPVFAACERHGLLALFHTGTSGIGARQPGGQGIRLDYARPIRLDAVAAAHPGLTVVAAHFGWPWHMELVAMALHKSNVYIDISGWSPKRIPAELVRELRGRLAGQFLWGSDFPFITPERCLIELESLDLPEPVLSRVLH